MLENLLEYYRKSDGVTRKNTPGCIFAEKLVLEIKTSDFVFTVLATSWLVFKSLWLSACLLVYAV